MEEFSIVDSNNHKLEEGMVIVLVSDYFNTKKYKQLYSEFKGIPFVIKKESNCFYLFWEEHDLKFTVTETSKYLYNHSRYKYYSKVTKRQANFVERSGFNRFTQEFKDSFIKE